jgi:hypothetical protein
MILWILLLCLLFIGAVRLVNYARYDGFSLRGMLVVITVVAVLLGLTAYAIRK